MKLLLVLTFLFLSFGCFSQKTFSQRYQSQLAHASGGFVIGAVSYHFIHKKVESKWASRAASVIIVAMAAGLKEKLMDRRGKLDDIAWSVTGSICSFVITF